MARIPLGQNTPLTLIGVFTAESGSSQPRDGLTTVDGAATYITGGLQHTRDGDGGNYALRIETNQEVVFPFGGTIAREVIVAFPLWGEPRTTLNLLRGGNQYQGGIEVLDGNAIRLIRGESSLSITELERTVTGILPESAWSWCTLRWYTANSGGIVQFRMHSFANILFNYSGDTQASASFDNLDAARYLVDGVSGDVRMDDIFVFARTLYYTGGAGTIPAAGQTITDAGTGGTLKVDSVTGTNVAGVIIAYSVSDLGFVATNAIGNGAGWTAVASNALDNAKGSLWIPEGFSIPSTLSSDQPNTGAQQWLATNVPPQAHYQQVDDWTSTADYVYTGDAGDLDQYGTTEGDIPSGATVIGLILSTWGNNSVDVSQIALGYYDGVGNNDGPDQTLPSTLGRNDMLWTYNARTGVPFTLGQITALETRLTSVA